MPPDPAAGGGAADGVNSSGVDESLYSRQLYVMGHEAQVSLRRTKAIISLPRFRFIVLSDCYVDQSPFSGLMFLVALLKYFLVLSFCVSSKEAPFWLFSLGFGGIYPRIFFFIICMIWPPLFMLACPLCAWFATTD